MSASEQPIPHLAIRASAGTGKTYRLTSRYLELLARGVSPQEILATTFTRKAAREILERVVERLADAVDREEKRGELSAAVGRNVSAEEATRWLAVLLRKLHRVRIGTLDSFFQRVARCFSLELGLSPDWEIADEIEECDERLESVRRLLETQGQEPLARLLRLLSHGDVRRAVRREVAELVRELRDAWRECEADSWSWLAERLEETECRPLEAGELEEILAVLERSAIPEHKGARKAHLEAIEKARAGDWTGLLGPGKWISNMLEEEPSYCKKPIPLATAETYRRVIAHAKAVLLWRTASQNEATRDLLERHDRVLASALRLGRRLGFDQVTRLLAAGALQGRLEEVFYRLDGSLHHLLLDEFQDTSVPQWEALRPLAREIGAWSDGSHTLLCVGDIKQAIYGWRGGVSELFDTAVKSISGIVEESLDVSRRSAPEVIETVNALFENLPANPLFEEKHRAAAEWWQRQFRRHETVRSELSGWVEVRVSRSGSTQSEKRKRAIEAAAAWIGELQRRSPRLEIGVLVRTNDHVSEMIDELRLRGVGASEEGGGPLAGNPAVDLLLSALRLADHPGDTAATFHVARSPLGARLEIDPADAMGRDAESRSRRVTLARRLRRRLQEEGYARTVGSLAETLFPHCDAGSVARLTALADLAARLDEEGVGRAVDLARLAVRRRAGEAASHPVHVMTIHQSKGLQFDTVVLPDLDVPLTGQTPPLVAERDGPARPAHRVCRYISQQVREIDPEIARLFEGHEEQAVRESLCLLYVAVTRAARGLLLIVPASSKKDLESGKPSFPATFAGLVRGALAPAKTVEIGDVLWQRGKESALAAPGPAERTKSAPAPRRELGKIALAPPEPARRRFLPRETPSGDVARRSVSARDILRAGSTAALRRGSILHGWFELVEWIEDGLPSDDDLRSAAARWHPDREETAGLLARFRDAVAREEVRGLLSRQRYLGEAGDTTAGELEVLREHPFAIMLEERLLSGTFDRLVITRREGRPMAAEVLDFKTDSIDPEDAKARSRLEAHYAPQLEAYRQAAARITGIAPAKIGARLVFVGSR